MINEETIDYQIEEIRSEVCKEFISFHTDMINNVEKALVNEKSNVISILTNMEQQSFNLFKEMEECQNGIIKKIGRSMTTSDKEITFRDSENEENVENKNIQVVKEYEEDYSLESVNMNRYEVYVSDLSLEKKELYTFYNKGIVLSIGYCSEELTTWIESLGLEVRKIPEDAFDTAIETYFDSSFVGVIGMAKKGWSEEKCYSFVRQMFFAAKYTSIMWYKNRIKPFFVTVTRLGGKFGIDSDDTEFVTGSLSGLCKTAAREWMSNVSTHYIDVNSQIQEKKLVEYISQEIKYGTEVEIGYPSDKQRVCLRLREKYESKLDPRRPNKNDVFLVSGGGRGITSICIKEMAKRFQCKFILFGRTELEDDFNDCYEGLNLEEIREIIIKKKQTLGQQIKYVDANKMAQQVLAQREIRNTLQEIKDAGSDVIYFSCDVTDMKTLNKIVNEGSKRLGNITGIIHGAGILSDRLLNKKTEEDFFNVFGVKYFGMNNIMKEINIDNLKFIFVFSSIAGFFGNFGQSDYSCGNEYLNHFVRYWKKKKPDLKVMAINWGPWDAGMVDQALKVAMVRRGKTLIQPDIGKLFFVDAFAKQWDESESQIIVNDVNGLGGAL